MAKCEICSKDAAELFAEPPEKQTHLVCKECSIYPNKYRSREIRNRKGTKYGGLDLI